MKKLLLATIAFAALASPVLAADLAVKAPYMAAAPVPTWIGFYVGGTIGAGMHSSQFGDGDEDITYPIPAIKSAAVNVGATVGYNWQVRSFVLGVEGDASW